MREFEKYEMNKSKCPVCGCRNKVHTEMLDYNRKFVGYNIKCCNCGNVTQFLLDYENNGSAFVPPYKNSKQTCIQPSYCPRKDCKLYGTCNYNYEVVENKKPKHDDTAYETRVEVVNPPRFL